MNNIINYYMNRPHEWTKKYDPHRGTYVMMHKGTGIIRPFRGGLVIPARRLPDTAQRLPKLERSLHKPLRKPAGDEILKRLSTLKL